MQASSALHMSAHAYQMAHKAMDYAVKAMAGADPLVPFAMTWRDNEVMIEPFKLGAYDDAIEMAMREVNRADDGVSGYAVVWNAYIEVEGQKREAIVAEVADRQAAQAIQVAQAVGFMPEGMARPEGDMMALGEADNLLRVKLDYDNMEQHLIKPAYVTSNGQIHEVVSQPYARMPAALICLAANLCVGEEAERLTRGLRTLQAMEGERSVAIIHHVFGTLITAMADGDLMHVLPSDDLADMMEMVMDGAAQIRQQVSHGALTAHDADAYLAAMHTLAETVLTDAGRTALPTGGEKLLALVDTATRH